MMEERQNNYTLTIENVNESNLGEYTCTAVNKIGDGQDVVFLSGKNSYRPEQPNWEYTMWKNFRIFCHSDFT